MDAIQAMNMSELNAVQAIFRKADERKGRQRVELGRKPRYIRAIYRVPGGYEISGKAGTRYYNGYSMREAERHYNALARTYA